MVGCADTGGTSTEEWSEERAAEVVLRVVREQRMRKREGRERAC